MHKGNSGFLKVIVIILIAVGGLLAVFFATDIGTTKLSGDVTTKVTKLDRYKSLQINGSGTIELRDGSERSIEVTTDKLLQKKINIKQDGTDVKVDMDKLDMLRSFKLDNDEITYIITSPNFEEFYINGNFVIKSDGEISGDHISLKTKGKSEVELEILANNFTLETNGYHIADITGKATTNTAIKTNGYSEITTVDFSSPITDVTARGNHEIHLGKPKALSLSLYGMNQVEFDQSPTEMSTKIQGHGIVQQSGLDSTDKTTEDL